MLKRLTQRLVVLFVLAAVLVPLLSSSSIRNKQGDNSRGFYCYRIIDEWGNCRWLCCDSNGECSSFSCS
jgi:hypothetical protein